MKLKKILSLTQKEYEDKNDTYTYAGMLFEKQSLSRVQQHISDENRGFMAISASRGNKTEKENIQRHESLKRDLRNYNLGFWVVDGGWIENKGTDEETEVKELTCFVSYKENQEMSFEQFKNIGIKLAKKYDQDGVLIKPLGKLSTNNPMFVYDKNGNIDMKFTKVRLDRIEEYFTKLRKNSHKGRSFVFEAVQKPTSHISAVKLRALGQIW